MAITYTRSTQKLVLTGFSAVTPGTFTDIDTADRAGNVQLLAPTATPYNSTLTYQVQPADSCGLKIDFVVTNYVGPAGSIVVTGTDIDGNAQNETLTINGNGTFTTTKWYATITNVNATGGGSFTFEVIQNRWGIVCHPETDVFYINADLEIGDGITNTWFDSIDEHITIEGGWKGLNKSNITVGQLTSDIGIFGTKIHVKATISTNGINWSAPDTIKIYGSTIVADDYSVNMRTASGGTLDIVNVRMDSSLNSWYLSCPSPTFSRVSRTVSYNGAVGFSFISPMQTATELVAVSNNFAIGFSTAGAGDIEDTECIASATKDVQVPPFASYIYNMIDVTWDEDPQFFTPISLMGFFNLYDRKSFNVTVLEIDGATPISGARVRLIDDLGTTAVDLTTNAQGQLASDQNLIKERWWKIDNFTIGNEDGYFPYKLIIEKANYRFQELPFNPTYKTRLQVKLPPVGGVVACIQ